MVSELQTAKMGNSNDMAGEELGKTNEKKNCSFRVWLAISTVVWVMLLLATAIYLALSLIEVRAEISKLRRQFVELKQTCDETLQKTIHDQTDRPSHMHHSIMKRSTLDDSVEESDHEKLYHHGIQSHDIALIYADPASLNWPNVTRERKFSNDDDTSSPGCGGGYRLMQNRINDLLCNNTRDDQVAKMKFTARSQQDHATYHFFVEAPWMRTERSGERYSLRGSGKINVFHKGTYIVHASIHFVVSDKEVQFPAYSIYKTNRDEHNKKLITKCVVTVENMDNKKIDGDDIFPCQAWQLVQLDEGDIVYMTIANGVWFRIEKETFHLSLIKLNDNPKLN